MADKIMCRIVSFQGKQISYLLERKEVKNLNLRVRKDGKVYVSAHRSVPPEEIDAFVIKSGARVLEALGRFQEVARYQPAPKRYVSGESFYILGRGLRLKVIQAETESIFSDGVFLYLRVKDTEDSARKEHVVAGYLRQQCEAVFGELLAECYPIFRKYGVSMPTLRIRRMETRWGSCLPKKGIITLNTQLLEVPRDCIAYVVMHELCHFIHPNHSKQFYHFLTMLMPDWKERKAVLERSLVNRV